MKTNLIILRAGQNKEQIHSNLQNKNDQPYNEIVFKNQLLFQI